MEKGDMKGELRTDFLKKWNFSKGEEESQCLQGATSQRQGTARRSVWLQGRETEWQEVNSGRNYVGSMAILRTLVPRG